MKIFKNSIINLIFVTIISLFYSAIFFITSNHMEFESILYPGELESSFLNEWNNFLKLGNQKYIGIIFLVLTAVIVIKILLAKKKRYDEYQYSILKNALCIAGIISLILTPFILLNFLSVPNGLLESVLLLATVQWFVVLIYELIYAFRF